MFWADSVTYGSGDFDAGQVDPTARVRVGSVYVVHNDVYGNALCLMDETLARHAAFVMSMRPSDWKEGADAASTFALRADAQPILRIFRGRLPLVALDIRAETRRLSLQDANSCSCSCSCSCS